MGSDLTEAVLAFGFTRTLHCPGDSPGNPGWDSPLLDGRRRISSRERLCLASTLACVGVLRLVAVFLETPLQAGLKSLSRNLGRNLNHSKALGTSEESPFVNHRMRNVHIPTLLQRSCNVFARVIKLPHEKLFDCDTALYKAGNAGTAPQSWWW